VFETVGRSCVGRLVEGLVEWWIGLVFEERCVCTVLNSKDQVSYLRIFVGLMSQVVSTCIVFTYTCSRNFPVLPPLFCYSFFSHSFSIYVLELTYLPTYVHYRLYSYSQHVLPHTYYIFTYIKSSFRASISTPSTIQPTM